MTTSPSGTGAPVRGEMPAALSVAAGARPDRLGDATKMRLVVDGRLFVMGVVARPMPRLAFARTFAHPASAGSCC